MEILVFEDDYYIANQLKSLLGPFGNVDLAKNINELKCLSEKKKYDFATLDLEVDGELQGLNALHEMKDKTKCFVLSSREDELVIEEAYQKGAEHFLSKKHFQANIDFFIKQIRSESEHELKLSELQNALMTNSPKLLNEIKDLISLVDSKRPILITGPTGVGKTYFANKVHDLSTCSGDFVSMNCAGIVGSLIESELFGHVKGAFTDAKENKTGLMTKAHNGTLFLDEVGSMSTNMQKALLKAVEERSYLAVGGSQKIKSDFRLISATCEDIFSLVNEGRFRRDFFYRINGVNLYIPPLKERREDIKLCLNYFVKLSPRKIYFESDALELLIQYDWPGNVREIKHFIENLIAKAKSRVSVSDLPQRIRSNDAVSNFHIPSEHIEFVSAHGLKNYMRMLEAQMSDHFLKKNDGHITRCIKELKISNSAFYRIRDEARRH